MKKFSPLSYVSMSTVNAMVSALLMDRTTAKLKIISDQPLVDFLSPSALEKANTSKQGLDLRKLSPELFVLLHAAFGNAAVPSRDKWDNYIVFRIPMSLEVKFVGHDIGVSMGGEGDSPGLTLSFHPFKKTPEAKAASIHAAEKLFHFMVEAEPMFDEKI